jgi:hypothetical protein
VSLFHYLGVAEFERPDENPDSEQTRSVEERIIDQVSLLLWKLKFQTFLSTRIC